MQQDLTLWHNRRDTLLRIVDGRLHDRELTSPAKDEPLGPLEGTAPYYSVYIPIGVSPGTLRRHNITLEYDIDLPYAAAPVLDQRPYQTQHQAQKTAMRIGLDQENVRGNIRRITPDLLAHLRYLELHDPEPRRIRPYLEMERVFKTQTERRRPAYYEAVLHFVPPGAKLTYRVKLYDRYRPANILPPMFGPNTKDPDSTADPAADWYSVYALAPEFTRRNIFYCPSNVGVPDVNVGYMCNTPAGVTGRPEDLVTFRFDFVDVRRAINDFEIRLQRPDGPVLETSQLSFAWLDDTRDLDLETRARPISEDWSLEVLPVVNAQFDYVTLTVPRRLLSEGTAVIWRQEQIATVAGDELMLPNPVNVKPVRLLFMHYANQSLNDLFESPNKSYSPPRTYIQTTMQDELGTYSSRPNANETGIGDGYRFVFEQHRKNRLPGVFALNGGFLTMLAQDDPKQFGWIKERICAGDFEPAIGGWAGHRMLYFNEATNAAALQYGIDVMESLLPGTSRAFHPNSRLYAATSNIDNAIAAARITHPLVREACGRGLAPPREKDEAKPKTPAPAVSVQFVVIDQAAFRAYTNNEKLDLTPYLRSRKNEDLWGGHKHSYIWRQPCPQHPDAAGQCPPRCRSWYWLIIDKKMKDELFSASEDEWRAGKLFWQLRYHFFYGVSKPSIVENSLLVYGDDCDKAAANGWFDGDYNGDESNNAAKFAAALEWIAAHPWLEVVATADLRPDTEYVGTIEIKDAIDPSIHEDEYGSNDGVPLLKPHWNESRPLPGDGDFTFERWAVSQIGRHKDGEASGQLGFEYARWYLAWKNFNSPWLNRTLGELNEELDGRIMAPLPNTAGRELKYLAQLAYLMALHEAHWSKKPLESHIPAAVFEEYGFGDKSQPLPAYRRAEVLEPENFVLALSLQARNAHVFWCAAVWADLCSLEAGHPDAIDAVTRQNDGPLIKRIRLLCGQSPDGPQDSSPDRGLYWDLDVTPNVILYNNQLLVVMDHNGGRITHIFTRAEGGRPVVVSGNIKAYQFLGDDRQYGGQLPCNGSIFQNTVFAPNHQYVASDVRQSRPTAGKRRNPKTKIETKRNNDRSVRVAVGTFGNEDWLYPDNFNHYRLVDSGAANAVTWEYPGLAWQLDGLMSDTFDTALKDYRCWILGGAKPAAMPSQYRQPDGGTFQKTIALTDNCLTISYRGQLKAGHLVANEFSLDLYQLVMQNRNQRRCWLRADSRQLEPGDSQSAVSQLPNVDEIKGCELRTVTGAPAVQVLLDDRCRFSQDTLDANRNRRLHRAFSDCLEIESVQDGAFSYTIQVAR
jgi:hypothetical protein